MTDPRTRPVIQAALRIHRMLGPGLLESAYHRILAYELRRLGHRVECEVPIDLVWQDDCVVRGAFKVDMVVDGVVLVELKATRSHHPVHVRQMLTYLEFSRLEVGLLIDFGRPALIDGVQRFVR